MAVNSIYNRFESSKVLASTQLESLADGDVWHSEAFAETDLHTAIFVKFWYSIVWAATPTVSDKIEFSLVSSDQHASAIWPGSVSAAEGVLDATADAQQILLIDDNCPVAKTVTSSGSTTLTQEGEFALQNLSPSWKLSIKPTGAALGAGNVIRYRQFSPQGQT